MLGGAGLGRPLRCTTVKPAVIGVGFVATSLLWTSWAVCGARCPAVLNRRGRLLRLAERPIAASPRVDRTKMTKVIIATEVVVVVTIMATVAVVVRVVV